MAYVPVPKDLSKVKTKVAFNLTKRQIVCFAAALLIGLPLFFLLKGSAGTNLAAMAMIVVMLPCFLLAMYEKHGQPLEVVVRNVSGSLNVFNHRTNVELSNRLVCFDIKQLGKQLKKLGISVFPSSKVIWILLSALI